MNVIRNTEAQLKAVGTDLFARVRAYCEDLQAAISSEIEEIDGQSPFVEDLWKREEGGGGRTRVLQNGRVFEKAGVNTSTVYGMMPEAIARRMNIAPSFFSATGFSLVIHPQSPMIPTAHANFRYFERTGGDAWFGGGSDLTPFFPFEEDFIHFHTVLKRSCDSIDTSFYAKFKKSCDEYFYIRHRGETRGIGGIFFDYLRTDCEKCFALVRSVGDSFLESYVPIVKRRMNEPWGEQERHWQLLRRGRYAEFNLVYDRGTIFGLETEGRTESILMSLPPSASWAYNAQPQPGSREERLVEILRHPRAWVGS